MTSKLSAALVCCACVTSASSAGTFPYNNIESSNAQALSYRSITIDNDHPYSRAQGRYIDEIRSRGAGGSTTASDGRWYMEDYFLINHFANDDAITYQAEGRLDLKSTGDSQRIQGISSHEFNSFTELYGPVEYDFTTTITFDRVLSTGDIDATFELFTYIDDLRGQLDVADYRLIDLTENTSSYILTGTGIYTPSGFRNDVISRTTASLSVIIDSPDESAFVEYTMTTTVSLHAIPAPASLIVLTLPALTRARRRV